MKQIAPGQPKDHSPVPEAIWWISMMATLSLSLWVANLLPIQPVRYQLSTNIAISEHRLTMLERLKPGNRGAEELPFQLLRIEATDTAQSQSTLSELRSVRVVLQLNARSQSSEIEKMLDELTVPKMQTAECLELSKQILKQKWIVESNAHAKLRFELDRERDKLAIATDPAEKDERIATEQTKIQAGPFRLTSHSSSASSDVGPPALQTQKQIEQSFELETQKLESMQLTLERLKAKARGFLSTTGAPKLEPLVQSITVGRMSILVVLVGAVWILLAAWISPQFGSKVIASTSKRNRPAKRKSDTTASAAKTYDELPTTIRWLERSGVPYLGSASIAAGSHEPIAAPKQSHSNTLAISTEQKDSLRELVDRPLPTRHAALILRNIAEGSLVLWIGLLTARMMFDSVWRELLFYAPLSAISKMIVGVS